MTFPALLFGLLIATLYGSLFHLIVGGGPARLGFYLLVAWVGFWGGHFLGNTIGFALWKVGPIHLDLATISAGTCLVIGHWLSEFEA